MISGGSAIVNAGLWALLERTLEIRETIVVASAATMLAQLKANPEVRFKPAATVFLELYSCQSAVLTQKDVTATLNQIPEALIHVCT